MKKNLKFNFVFALMSAVLVMACSSSDETNSLEEIAIEQTVSNENLQARDGDHSILYRKVTFNNQNKNGLLEQMIIDFTVYLYMDLNFDSSKQVVNFGVEQDNISNELSLKYELINLDDLDPLALMFVSGLDNSNTTNAGGFGTEKINIDCNGGTKDGTNIVVDRPTGIFSATKVAKQINKFMSDCLDGGGCIEACKVEATISQ